MMEFLVVAGAATILAATSFGALRSLAANSRVEEAKATITHVRNQIALYRTRMGALPGGVTSAYTYYHGQVPITGYFYHTGPPPADPFRHASDVWGVVATSQAAAITELGGNGGTGGWIYNAVSGQFWINLNSAEYGTNPTIGARVRLTGDPSTW